MQYQSISHHKLHTNPLVMHLPNLYMNGRFDSHKLNMSCSAPDVSFPLKRNTPYQSLSKLQLQHLGKYSISDLVMTKSCVGLFSTSGQAVYVLKASYHSKRILKTDSVTGSEPSLSSRNTCPLKESVQFSLDP